MLKQANAPRPQCEAFGKQHVKIGIHGEEEEPQELDIELVQYWIV